MRGQVRVAEAATPAWKTQDDLRLHHVHHNRVASKLFGLPKNSWEVLTTAGEKKSLFPILFQRVVQFGRPLSCGRRSRRGQRVASLLLR